MIQSPTPLEGLLANRANSLQRSGDVMGHEAHGVSYKRLTLGPIVILKLEEVSPQDNPPPLPLQKQPQCSDSVRGRICRRKNRQALLNGQALTLDNCCHQANRRVMRG